MHRIFFLSRLPPPSASRLSTVVDDLDVRTDGENQLPSHFGMLGKREKEELKE